MNLYGYCENQPGTQIDPLGLASLNIGMDQLGPNIYHVYLYGDYKDDCGKKQYFLLEGNGYSPNTPPPEGGSRQRLGASVFLSTSGPLRPKDGWAKSISVAIQPGNDGDSQMESLVKMAKIYQLKNPKPLYMVFPLPTNVWMKPLLGLEAYNSNSWVSSILKAANIDIGFYANWLLLHLAPDFGHNMPASYFEGDAPVDDIACSCNCENPAIGTPKNPWTMFGAYLSGNIVVQVGNTWIRTIGDGIFEFKDFPRGVNPNDK
jgi:hypothetical protein